MSHMSHCVVFGLTLLATVLAASAPNNNSLLFFRPVCGSERDIAVKAGFTVVELESEEWSTITTTDVATYRAVVFGDQFCQFSSPAVLAPVELNRAVWSAAVTGNVIVVGTDPSFHRFIDGTTALVDQSIKFAAAEKNKTGLYASLSCYYANAPETTSLTWLDQFGDFRVRGQLECYNKVHIVATHPAISNLADDDLSDWNCSVHEIIHEYPSNFAPLVIAQNATGLGSKVFIDESEGVPYIVARGVKIMHCGDGSLDLGEECDDGNNEDGDGCSSTCRKEATIRGECSLCSPDPGQNECHITTSCSITPHGNMCACRPGYKSKDASSDTSLQWKIKWSISGHEHRVYVKPGTPCDALCEESHSGDVSCAEVSTEDCEASQQKHYQRRN